MIATNNPKLADEAVPLLRAALVKEPESSDAYEQLAMAYGHNKNYAEADLASAAGRLRARRQQDGARAGRPGKDAICGRIARLGKSRRHRRFQ